MNQEALNHHAELHEWHDLHVLHSKLGCSKGTDLHYLPPKKLQQIESWRQDVNQCLNPPKKLQKKQLYMRISSSYLTGRQGKSSDSTKRKCHSAKVRKNSEKTVNTERVSSAKSRTRYGQNDLHTVTNNIVDSSLHYSAQRQEIYSRPSSGKDRSIAVNNRAVLNGDKNATSELEKTHKHLNGWVNHDDKTVVNSSLLKETLSSQVDRLQTDLESGKVARNGHSSEENGDQFLGKGLKESIHIGLIDPVGFKSDNEENVKIEKVDNQEANNKLNSNYSEAEGHKSGSTSKITEEGKESEINDLDMESPGRLIHVKNRPLITSRSSSNKILNFYSIDDCKLTCRYRPNTLREREPRIKVTLAQKSETDQRDKIEEEKIVLENDISISHGNKTENENEAGVSNGVGNTKHVNGDCDYDIQTNTKHVNGDGDYDIQTVTSIFDDTVTLSKTASLSSHYDKNFMSSRSDVTLDVQPNNISGTNDVSESITNPSNYGRITSLNAPSEHMRQREKKQVSRPVRVSRAIDIMVDDRKVMNTMHRDFDGRTKIVGRTIIEKNEGSETFKRMNHKLKKQIEDLMHKRSTQVYKVYHKRKNSESGSVSGSVKS